MIDSIIGILKTFNDVGVEDQLKILASVQNLIDVKATQLVAQIDIEGCKHPESSRRNVTAMGDEFESFYCQACGEIIETREE